MMAERGMRTRQEDGLLGCVDVIDVCTARAHLSWKHQEGVSLRSVAREVSPLGTGKVYVAQT